MTNQEKLKEIIRQYNTCKSPKKKSELVRAIKRIERIERLEVRNGRKKNVRKINSIK